MSAREPDDPLPPMVAVDAGAHLHRKLAALRAHATQVRVEGEVFALSDGVAQVVRAAEGFQLVAGTLGPTGDAGREHDLLS